MNPALEAVTIPSGALTVMTNSPVALVFVRIVPPGDSNWMMAFAIGEPNESVTIPAMLELVWAARGQTKKRPTSVLNKVRAHTKSPPRLPR
jgi:hypothetical protein